MSRGDLVCKGLLWFDKACIVYVNHMQEPEHQLQPEITPRQVEHFLCTRQAALMMARFPKHAWLRCQQHRQVGKI